MQTITLTRFAYSPDGIFGRAGSIQECLDDNPPPDNSENTSSGPQDLAVWRFECNSTK